MRVVDPWPRIRGKPTGLVPLFEINGKTGGIICMIVNRAGVRETIYN